MYMISSSVHGTFKQTSVFYGNLTVPLCGGNWAKTALSLEANATPAHEQGNNLNWIALSELKFVSPEKTKVSQTKMQTTLLVTRSLRPGSPTGSLEFTVQGTQSTTTDQHHSPGCHEEFFCPALQRSSWMHGGHALKWSTNLTRRCDSLS